MNKKLDLKKKYKKYFYPDIVPEIIDIEPLQYLSIKGSGAPECSEFSKATSTLYSTMYRIRFEKKNANMDFVVPPLEGLWWSEDIRNFIDNTRDKWKWKLMIMTPNSVVLDDLRKALIQLEKKKKRTDLHDNLKLETISENTVVQVMHRGPFSEEGNTISNMHSFAVKLGYEIVGKHHEIYLSDFRRTDPKKLKTVLRQPIRLTHI